MKKLGKVGLIARFKPLHNGAAKMLEAVCQNSESVLIGVGSANKYNMRNPFTAQESEEMIRAFLVKRFDNFDVIHVPDSAHIPEYDNGKKWVKYVTEHFGSLDSFVTGNDYVKKLLEPHYNIIHPGLLIPKEEWIYLKAANVRLKMAMKSDWENYVPEPVADYIISNRLDERFRKEFGLQTLCNLTDESIFRPETAEEEKIHTYER